MIQELAFEDERELTQLGARLACLKALNMDKAVVSLWIVHRKLNQGKARYSALKIETEEKLRKKLATAVSDKIGQSTEVHPYAYVTTDQDKAVLEQPVSTTDFDEIISLVNRNGEEHKVDSSDQIVGAWGYVIKLQIDDVFVYAFRKIGGGWASNKVGNNWFFNERVMMELDDKPVFRADKNVDFIAFDGSVFILNKGNFENAINFREGMTRHRDEILGEFADSNLVSDIEVIRSVVGDNLNRLRKLASVRRSGYYKLPWYMEKLKKINNDQDWGLTINSNGQIESTVDNVDLILTLLNNNRLLSPITDETFDVPLKRPVAEPA